MKEVEIKAKLDDKEKITNNLKKLGCVFERPVTQEDLVYVRKTGLLADYLSNDVFLRIRVNNDNKIFFAVKKRGVNNLDAAIEHEFEINSKEEMEQALAIMGYKKVLSISKTRTITHYNGCEICIDNVEELGDFIEMEKLTQEGSSEVIQEYLFKFFEAIGIEQKARITSGYDILMLEKKGFSENFN